ncbi:MAG: hypothetical protein AAF460_08160 [Pseudomonadota bacterium]
MRIVNGAFLVEGPTGSARAVQVNAAGEFVIQGRFDPMSIDYEMRGELSGRTGKGRDEWRDAATGETLCAWTVAYIRRELRRYATTVLGLTLGESTLENIQRKIGSDLVHVTMRRFQYSDAVHVTFHADDKLNTVIIYDTNYQDENGVMVGAPRSDVESLSSTAKKCPERFCLDPELGILYRFSDTGTVSRIVYANEILLP